MDFFQQNSFNFALAQKMNKRELGAVLMDGPNGAGLRYNGLIIHEPQDPLNEAVNWVDQALSKVQDKQSLGLALVFGLGLGWHLKALRMRMPGISIIVFEPEEAMLNTYKQNGVFDENIDGPAPIIVRTWPEYEKLAGDEIAYGASKTAIIVCPEAYKNVKPEAFGTFEMFTQQQILRRAVIEETKSKTSEQFLLNLAQNTEYLCQLPDIMTLKGNMPPVPVFLVGSAPSLNESAPLLKELGGNGLIFAASSALKPLLSYGVLPDLVLALESSDTSGYLTLTEEQWALVGDKKIVLALSASSHSNHFKVPGFQQCVFYLDKGEADLFGNGVILPQGGNAGSAIFALAYCMGLAPLVLVAQDQAYAGGKRHADGTPGGDEGPAAGDLQVQAVGGGEVSTDSGLLASLSWFAEAAQTIKNQENAPALYNASFTGASIPGFNEVPLNAILASLPPADKVIKMDEFIKLMPKPSKKEIKQDVHQMANLVGTLRRLAKMDHRKALKEVKNLCEISSFMAKLLGAAFFAQGKNELVKELNNADIIFSTIMSGLSD